MVCGHGSAGRTLTGCSSDDEHEVGITQFRADMHASGYTPGQYTKWGDMETLRERSALPVMKCSSTT